MVEIDHSGDAWDHTDVREFLEEAAPEDAEIISYLGGQQALKVRWTGPNRVEINCKLLNHGWAVTSIEGCRTDGDGAVVWFSYEGSDE